MAPKPRTRTWSVPTSPRNPKKLPDELRLLLPFDGRLWNEAAQREYAAQLAQSDSFEGSVSATEPDFSARDRVNRSPKTFGFVELRRGRPLHITDAGHALLLDAGLDDLFLRQLLKWQYPSPVHSGADYREFFAIRPFLEMLRLARDLDGLSKVEIAIFGVTLTNWHDYGGCHSKIRAFRKEYESQRGSVARLEVVRSALIQSVRTTYVDDIAAGRIGTREGRATDIAANRMIETKARNCRDYADAAVRYFRATGLFTLSAHYAQLHLLAERLEEVDSILKEFERSPLEFATEDAYYAWLGNPHLPELPSDDAAVMRRQVLQLFDELPQSDKDRHAEIQQGATTLTGIHDLRRLYAQTTDLAAQVAQREAERGFVGIDHLDEIANAYDQIAVRDPEIVDRPAWFEWNTWRALCMLDDGRVEPHFVLDRLGHPFGPAPGRGCDIQCTYSDFVLAVEVTLATGATQHRMEAEPVERHVGLLQQAVRDGGDARPVYGVFIAPSLAPTTVAHFWQLHNLPKPTREYRGHVRVVPLTISDFRDMLGRARHSLPINSGTLHAFVGQATELASATADEVAWREGIRALIAAWVAPASAA